MLRLAGTSAVAALIALSGCKTYARPTPPPAAAPAEQVAVSGASMMIGVGDIARCDSDGAAQTAALVDSVLRAAASEDVERAVFTLGDNVYTSGTVLQFANCFEPTWGDSNKLIMKYIRPSPGNHEYYTAGADPYYKYFGERAGEPGKGYYSYEIGEWLAVAINSEIAVNSGFGAAERTAQEAWLTDLLREHGGRCVLAYFHHPRFSSGRHGDNAALRPIWNILYEHDVDLVLVGHDHHYERFLPQTPDGAADTVKGIVQLVAGTGGATLRPVNTPLARHSANHVVGRYGVVILTLGAEEWRSAFLEVDGRVWDQSGGRCH